MILAFMEAEIWLRGQSVITIGVIKEKKKGLRFWRGYLHEIDGTGKVSIKELRLGLILKCEKEPIT